MDLNYKCEFCNKKFAKEKTLIVHVCEKKRRHLSRDEKHVRSGFLTYQRFYEISQGFQGKKTFNEFANSPYYTAFIKFGSLIANTNPIFPERFIEWVIRSGVKLDHWARDEMYDKYIIDLIKTEPADGAIQRTIGTMMDWAEENDSTWEHYFKYVNLNRATYQIREGKISPWIIFNCKSGKEMLQNMNDEQLEILSPFIDPKFWIARFKKTPADIQLVKDVIKEAGLE